NPVTGRERRRWHRCEDQSDAERVARTLTTDHERRHRAGSSMTLGDYLLGQWLPAREAAVARSTHARDRKATEHYLLPHLGDTPPGHGLPARDAAAARSTHARDRKATGHYLLPHLGDTPLRRLRAEHIRSLYQRLLITGSRRGGPLAAKTIANLHQLLRSALR